MGSTNPSQIPTQQAYSAVLGYMADTGAPLSIKNAQIGFTNPQDLTYFENQITSGDLSIGDLQNNLSATGWTQFNSFSVLEKQGMQEWQLDDGQAQGGGTPPPSAGLILTYERMTVINPGSGQQISWFGSATGYDTEPNPDCNAVPPPSSAYPDVITLTFNNNPYITGTISGLTETVSGTTAASSSLTNVNFSSPLDLQSNTVV